MHKYSKIKITKYFIGLKEHLLAKQYHPLQWRVLSRKTKHHTLPYYTALELLVGGFDHTVRCGQIYDFRFATQSESLLWQAFLKRLTKILKKIDTK